MGGLLAGRAFDREGFCPTTYSNISECYELFDVALTGFCNPCELFFCINVFTTVLKTFQDHRKIEKKMDTVRQWLDRGRKEISQSQL